MAVSAAKIDDTTWSSFDIRPSPTPTSEKERAARLVERADRLAVTLGLPLADRR